MTLDGAGDSARRARYAAAPALRLPAGERCDGTRRSPACACACLSAASASSASCIRSRRRSELPTEKLKAVLEVLDAEPVIDARVLRAARVRRAVLPPPARRSDRRGAAQARARRRRRRARSPNAGSRPTPGLAALATARCKRARAPARAARSAARRRPECPSDAARAKNSTTGARRCARWSRAASPPRRKAPNRAPAGRRRGRAGARRRPRAERRAGRRRRAPSMRRTGASRRSCCTASPAAARPRSICTRWSTRCGADGARWCWCPRSASRRSSSGASASASRCRWRCCIPRSPTPSGSRPGGSACPARRASCSARARRCSRRVADLGIVIVDEEHDASFKQHESGFRYSARDLAILRAQRAGAPIVLGSATPSLETLQNVDAGQIHAPVAAAARRARRCRRAPRSSTCASTRCARESVDARGRGHAAPPRRRRPGAGVHQPPRLFADARLYRLRLDRALPRLRCAPHRAPRRRAAALPSLRRRRAAARRTVRNAATRCKHVGQGTERVEETLAELFPGMPIARLDRDVVRKRGDLEAVVSRIASGEARILVGTQMVTKGHDFPNVTLVVVLNADQGLFSTDFRAPERVAQTIIQVAGRAGRGTQARRGADPDRISRAPVAAQPARRRVTTASRARRSPNARPRTGRRSRTSRRCAPRRRTLAPAMEFLRAARQLARPQRGSQGAGAGARGDGEARGAISRAVADRVAPNARRCIALLAEWLPRVEDAQDCRATCAGRSTWIRSIFSSSVATGSCRRLRFHPLRVPRVRLVRASERLAVACALRSRQNRRRHRARRLRDRPADDAPTAVAGICHSPPARQARPAVCASRNVKLRQ